MAARIFPKTDIVFATIVALIAQFGFVAMFKLGQAKPVVVDLTDENAKPVSVAITPMVDDLPMLKLGGKKQPGKLPDMWQKPKAAAKKSEGEQVASTKADTEHAPTTHSDAGVANDAASLDPIAGDAATDPNSNTAGSAAGVDGGKEEDPLKAHAKDQYKAEINAWFSARFHIRGKIPFDTLKGLHARVAIDISADRKMSGYDVLGVGSGNDVFDDQLYRDLAAVQASGAVLPPPPENYPDILGSKLFLDFRCTVKAACE